MKSPLHVHCAFLGIVVLCTSGTARGQVVITEVMYGPGGADALWEWVEILNVTGAPADLDGWVFDDDDDGASGGAMAGANIVASPSNNTIVPAGGVAVLYPADELDFMPSRFTDAWGSGITMIGVDGFTSLTVGDAIGLWPSRQSYNADAIEGATTSPRRTFNSTVASFNYATLDAADEAHSIAWIGTGSAADPARWTQSEEGQLGAFASEETTIENAQINSTVDRGNPGVLPPGPAAAGLRITEIMFAPDSPLVTVGYASDDFEWIEVFNNTSSPIDFADDNYVLDDIGGTQLQSANVTQGMLAPGGIGILFNDDKIAIEQMEMMWGAGINYIPVDRWPALNNAGPETIGIWDSYGDYDTEPMTDSPRTFDNAVAKVTYHTLNSQGWPTISVGSSIWLDALSGDPNDGENWTRAGATSDALTYNATPIFQMAVDHPGGDIGSPGYAPGSVTALPGDYNGDNVVDAADYVVWRKTNINGPQGYADWRANFGASHGSGASATAGLSSSAVPEPASFVVLLVIGFASQGLTLRRSRDRCRTDNPVRHTAHRWNDGQDCPSYDLLLSDRHELFAHRFDLRSGEPRQPVGETDQQRKVA